MLCLNLLCIICEHARAHIVFHIAYIIFALILALAAVALDPDFCLFLGIRVERSGARACLLSLRESCCRETIN